MICTNEAIDCDIEITELPHFWQDRPTRKPKSRNFPATAAHQSQNVFEGINDQINFESHNPVVSHASSGNLGTVSIKMWSYQYMDSHYKDGLAIHRANQFSKLSQRHKQSQ